MTTEGKVLIRFYLTKHEIKTFNPQQHFFQFLYTSAYVNCLHHCIMHSQACKHIKPNPPVFKTGMIAVTLITLTNKKKFCHGA